MSNFDERSDSTTEWGHRADDGPRIDDAPAAPLPPPATSSGSSRPAAVDPAIFGIYPEDFGASFVGPGATASAKGKQGPSDFDNWIAEDLAPKPQPDEKPASWGTAPTMPGAPQKLTLVVEPVLPMWITLPSDPEYQRRNGLWQSFAGAVGEAARRHATMTASLTAYRQAQNDPELGALRYPKAPGPVDVSTYTEQQKVPHPAGRTVGSLFQRSEGKETLPLDQNDRKAIGGARTAAQTNRGNVKKEGDQTADADQAVEQARAFAQAARRSASGAAHKLEAAMIRVRRALERRTGQQTARERADIESRLQSAQNIVEVLTDLASLVAFAAQGKEGLGDAIDKAGSLFNKALEADVAEKLDRLDGLIRQSQIREQNLLEGEVYEEYEEAIDAASATRSHMTGTVAGLLRSLGQQRDAHDEFAEAAVASVPDAPAATREKLGAMLSAMPLVDAAIYKARQLADDSEPVSADASAMQGFGIARSHGHHVVASFTRATNELAGVHQMARADELKWQQRKQELGGVRSEIIDEKAGG